MKKISEVHVVDRPGYFGKTRRQKEQEYDTKYTNWTECWQIDQHVAPFNEAVLLYDDAYHAYLDTHFDDLMLIRRYRDVYDSDPSNVLCGVEHDPLATPRHIQDISIRRALIRMGVWFNCEIDRLLQVRGEDSEGFKFNPGRVPFHMSSLILGPLSGGPTRPWMAEGSIETFWQRNKVIVLGYNE